MNHIKDNFVITNIENMPKVGVAVLNNIISVAQGCCVSGHKPVIGTLRKYQTLASIMGNGRFRNIIKDAKSTELVLKDILSNPYYVNQIDVKFKQHNNPGVPYGFLEALYNQDDFITVCANYIKSSAQNNSTANTVKAPVNIVNNFACAGVCYNKMVSFDAIIAVLEKAGHDKAVIELLKQQNKGNI